MSNENYDPEHDEYLNKLIKFEEKRNELRKIHNIVDKINEELPPREINKTKIPFNWFRIGGLIIGLFILAIIIYFIFVKDEGEDKKEASTSIIYKDTLNYTFYILNNVDEEVHFKLSFEQSNKIKEMLPDSSLYNIAFITQLGESKIQFGNKDSLILSLNEEIKNGGNMDWKGIISLFNSLNECCKSNITTKYFILGKTPEVSQSDKIASNAVFDLKSLKNLNNCTFVELIQFCNSTKDYEETTKFFEKFFTKYQIKHEVIKWKELF